MFNSKKGFTINDMAAIGITFVVTAVVLGLGSGILTTIQDTQTINSTEWNATGYGFEGLNTLASYMPTIALVAAAAVIIGIILVFFAKRQ